MHTKKRVFSLFTTFVMIFAFVGIMPEMNVGDKLNFYASHNCLISPFAPFRSELSLVAREIK